MLITKGQGAGVGAGWQDCECRESPNGGCLVERIGNLGCDNAEEA